METKVKKSLIVVHPYVNYDPGRFLEDALRSIGFRIDLFDRAVDFNLVRQGLYDAVLFIESPYRQAVRVMNVNRVKIPRLYWVLHGESRLAYNLKFTQLYRIDYLLLATSLHLAKQYRLPYQLFPMAVEPGNIPNRLPLAERSKDISFVGSFSKIYQERNDLLNLIQKTFPQRKICFKTDTYLKEMGEIYADSKIVFNWNYGNVLTMRLFEGMAAGSLMLTNYAHNIELLGQDGRHYVMYNGNDDLINKIDHYLTHLEQTQAIARAGYQKVLAEHTYLHRARLLERIIRQL